ncbi:amino acid ABC transporter permease [Castellaniella sp.]|uniref:amino acid ABC transporter permease n=1 Tax=Castellaniella sp. TaxID=1955812 RepID=UPI003A8F9BC3
MQAVDLILHASPFLLKGVVLTIQFALASMVLGMMLGIVISIMGISSNPILNYTARGYVSLMRGTPQLVQIFLIYYGLPGIGISLDPTSAGILALTANAGAYLAESMRGAILGVNRGQWAAAHSLGLSYLETLRFVICPQALRLAVPSLGNTLISLIKDTSLVSVITVTELLRSAQEVIATTFQPLPLYIAVALIYWVLSTALSWGQRHVETRLAQPLTR